MIKRLRRNFVLINMTIVTIMLGLIFALTYYSTCENLERESMRMMENIAGNPMMRRPPNPPADIRTSRKGDNNPFHDITAKSEKSGIDDKKDKDVINDKRDSNDDRVISEKPDFLVDTRPDTAEGMRIPYFSVILDESDNVKDIGGGFFDSPDKEYLDKLLKVTLENGSLQGVLKEYNLRFLIREFPAGRCIVFADMSMEEYSLKGLVRTNLAVGSVAFLLFLGISILLSKWAVKPIEKAWQQQKQFVADASHELKTPLTVITTDAELLQLEDTQEADKKTLIKNILTMTRQMRGLVEGLLDLSRLDSGRIKEEFSQVNLSDVLSEAAMLFEPVFYEKGLTLNSEIGEEIIVTGITAHLKQLINILLDNAVKYSLEGGDTIVRLYKNSKKSCTLEVCNKGEHINEEELKSIFERFYRGDKARQMNQSYGLGLSIALEITKEHRGKIRAESKGGYNSFYVELPCGDRPQA